MPSEMAPKNGRAGRDSWTVIALLADFHRREPVSGVNQGVMARRSESVWYVASRDREGAASFSRSLAVAARQMDTPPTPRWTLLDDPWETVDDIIRGGDRPARDGRSMPGRFRPRLSGAPSTYRLMPPCAGSGSHCRSGRGEAVLVVGPRPRPFWPLLTPQHPGWPRSKDRLLTSSATCAGRPAVYGAHHSAS
jgi:hypothetical protein